MTQAALFDANDRPTAAACRREALRSLTPKVLGDLHQAVLDALKSGPLTDDEIQARAGRPGGKPLRPRRVELCKRGLVVEAGGTRPGNSGREMTLWRAA